MSDLMQRLRALVAWEPTHAEEPCPHCGERPLLGNLQLHVFGNVVHDNGQLLCRRCGANAMEKANA